MTICKHCERRQASRSRGLCWTCHHNPAIRAQYPPAYKYNEHSRNDPTMEELDALEAEMRRNLPAWWGEAERRQTLDDRNVFKALTQLQPRTRRVKRGRR